MARTKMYFLLFLFIFITFKFGSPANILAEEYKPIKILQPHEYPTLTTQGRLILEKHGEKDRLTLRSKEGYTYLIKGALVEKLKDLLLDLEEHNLVTLEGSQDGSYNISCENFYQYDAEGNRKIETRCIRYYNLEVSKIIEAKKSDEEVPPPKRDIEEEEKAKTAALSRLYQQDLTQRVTGEIKGKISSLNLRSPIKTIEIAYRDKDNQPINKVFLLNPEVRIVKKPQDNEESMFLSVNSLKVDQEVSVVYFRDERKTEAIAITIIKD